MASTCPIFGYALFGGRSTTGGLLLQTVNVDFGIVDPCLNDHLDDSIHKECESNKCKFHVKYYKIEFWLCVRPLQLSDTDVYNVYTAACFSHT